MCWTTFGLSATVFNPTLTWDALAARHIIRICAKPHWELKLTCSHWHWDTRHKLNTNTSLETELKFHVPKSSIASFEKALQRGATQTLALKALYFDTAGRHLARQKIALRLRLENDQWIQTLKMSTSESFFTRIELNHPRPGPDLDLSVYACTPAEPLIAHLSEPLAVCYETQVSRLMRLIRTPVGVVEIAYDRGFVRADALDLPICEVELELKQGEIATLFSLASQWQRDHGLMMDARSKSERGDLLARLNHKLKEIDIQGTENPSHLKAMEVDKFWSARNAKSIALVADMSAIQGLQCVMAECLDQIIRNSAVLAHIDTLGIHALDTTEHVHQLRVGIRRMRTAWSLFRDLCELPTQAQRDGIKKYFALLGGSRDNNVLLNDLLPMLMEAGQPALNLQEQVVEDHASSVAQDPLFQSWLVQMSAFVHSPAPSSGMPIPSVHPQRLTKIILPKLRQWHRKILKEGLHFADLGTEARHELRKRVKKLRYALQFTDALLPHKQLKPYLKDLSKVQNILGEMNDLTNAQKKFTELRDSQPSAWFACGWITYKLDQLQSDAVNAFRQLSANRYWD
jgi:triphosphatase